MINLKKLNIILTGATGVIGNSILDKLISAGSNVLATGTNEEKLKKIKDKYKNLNVLKFDISDHQKIDKFVDNCNKILSNKIDVLINNAGITQDNLSIRMKEEEWKKVIDINLTSTFLITKNVIKKMLKFKKGKNNKYYLCSWTYGKYWTNKLCRIKSRNNCNVKKFSS